MIFRWLLFVALASPCLSTSSRIYQDAVNGLFDQAIKFLQPIVIARGDKKIPFPNWKGSKLWHLKKHDKISWPRFPIIDPKNAVVNISWACSGGELGSFSTLARTGDITVTPNQENNVLTVSATVGLKDLLISYKRCNFFVDGQPHKVKPPMCLKSSNNQFNFHIILKRDGRKCVSTVPEGKYKTVNKMKVTIKEPLLEKAFNDLLVEYKKEFVAKLGEKVHEKVKKMFEGKTFCDLLLSPIEHKKVEKISE